MRKAYPFGCLLLLPFLICSTVKVHSQSIEWQQVLGGAHSEYLYDVKATPDYGFLLAGSSFSGKTGTKTEAGQGDLDYFLWKMDESGKMEWQKSFGGSGSD
ncbi:MAG: T9SS C-terminal target domain-containing protein, partial [Moheibacter sp.]